MNNATWTRPQDLRPMPPKHHWQYKSIVQLTLSNHEVMNPTHPIFSGNASQFDSPPTFCTGLEARRCVSVEAFVIWRLVSCVFAARAFVRLQLFLQHAECE